MKHLVVCVHARSPLGGHVGLQPETRAIVERVGGWIIDVTGEREGYWSALDRAWKLGHGFINIEQDIVPTLEQLEELDQCPSEWCTLPYVMMGNYGTLLGCAKFGASLTKRDPGLVERVGRDWWGLDTGIWHQLTRVLGVREHVHAGRVLHLNPAHTGHL